MRDYGKVHTTFWASPNIRALSDDGRILALYLMTCTHGTIAGVFRLPDGYACEDLQWEAERVKEGFRELLANGFANRCETTKWVWIVKHLEWNQPENPNQRKSAAKMAGQIPDGCVWKQAFMQDHGESLGLTTPEPKKENGTVPEPLPNQKQYQEQKQEEETPSASADAEREPEYPKAFLTFWEAYPRKKAKGDAVKAWKKLKPSERLAGEILQAVQRAKTSADWLKEGGEFIPYPASWLNSRGWEDEITPVSTPTGGPERPWHQTASGITAKGAEWGVTQTTAEPFPTFKSRVMAEASRRGVEVSA